MPIDTETLAKIEANKKQWRESVTQEKNIPQRNKKGTDIIKGVFKTQWLLKQSGKSLDYKEKGNLWDQLCQKEPKFFTFVQSGKKQAYAISQEQQSAFKQYLQEQGYDVTTLDEKYQNIQRNKLDTDLASSEFQQQWILKRNGRSLVIKEKSNLWDQIYQTKPELFIVVQSGQKRGYVISQERQNDFKRYLQTQGYEVTMSDERYQGIQRNKLDNDLTSSVFQLQWALQQNGKSLNYKEKSDLWEQLYQANPELFTFVQSGKRQAYVISKEKQIAFKQYVETQGYDVTLSNEKYRATQRYKLDTDMIKFTFLNQWILQQDGKSLDKKEKNNLWEQICQAKPELFTYVQSGPKQAYVISKGQQSVFKQYLQEQGYDVTTPYDKLHEMQEQATQAKTPEERKKYLAIAKKIFETLNPKTAKDKTCEICLNKISQSRE